MRDAGVGAHLQRDIVKGHQRRQQLLLNLSVSSTRQRRRRQVAVGRRSRGGQAYPFVKGQELLLEGPLGKRGGEVHETEGGGGG
jgi:hypothetical protein